MTTFEEFFKSIDDTFTVDDPISTYLLSSKPFWLEKEEEYLKRVRLEERIKALEGFIKKIEDLKGEVKRILKSDSFTTEDFSQVFEEEKWEVKLESIMEKLHLSSN